MNLIRSTALLHRGLREDEYVICLCHRQIYAQYAGVSISFVCDQDESLHMGEVRGNLSVAQTKLVVRQGKSSANAENRITLPHDISICLMHISQEKIPLPCMPRASYRSLILDSRIPHPRMSVRSQLHHLPAHHESHFCPCTDKDNQQ